MSKAEIAKENFSSYNCAQSVLAAYAPDFGLDKETALSLAVGFGAGIGRLQETCGAVTGAVMAIGLSSRFKESDGRPKINEVYDKVHRFIDELTAEMKTVNCRELLKCDLSSEEGQKFFREYNLRDKCHGYVKLCCDLLDKYLET